MAAYQPVRFLIRSLIYILGLFCMAAGVAISVNADLGISPVNSLPYVLSVVSGASQSVCVIGVFSFYVLLQALLLRREFKLFNLTQVAFSTVFGVFVDIAKMLLRDFYIPTYGGRLVMVLLSIVVVAVGVVLYVGVDLVPMPMEGFTLAVAKKLGKPFPSTKIAVDTLAVLAGAALSLAFLHRLEGIREGTLLAAIVTGRVIDPLKALLFPPIQRLCFGALPERA